MTGQPAQLAGRAADHVVIRRAGRSDVHEIEQLWEAAALEPSARGFRNEIARLRRRDPELLLTAFEDGRMVADAAVEGLGDYFVGERIRVWISGGERSAFVIPASFVVTRFGVDYVRVRKDERTVVDVAAIGDPQTGVAVYNTFQDDGWAVVEAREEYPHVSHVANTNRCRLSAAVDGRAGKLLLFSAVDNLLKGASGAAVQNMNLALGHEEQLGLEHLT